MDEKEVDLVSVVAGSLGLDVVVVVVGIETASRIDGARIRRIHRK